MWKRNTRSFSDTAEIIVQKEREKVMIIIEYTRNHKRLSKGYVMMENKRFFTDGIIYHNIQVKI